MVRGHLTNEQKQLAFRLRARGWSLVDIGREVGCTAPMIGLMVREGKFRKGVADVWHPRKGCLGIAEREEILIGLRGSESLSGIARRLGRSASTISREVSSNGGPEHYSAWGAHRRARNGARRPKPCKLRQGPLLEEVSRRLLQLWSPDEIARRLPLDFPDDPEMRVSHETIYQSLFVQGRGELRRELARCLRSGRATRKKRGTVDKRGRIPGMVNISERPAEVADRQVPGHWEGDLILGEGRSQRRGHPRRALDSAPPPASPWRRPLRRERRGRDAQGHLLAAGGAAPHDHLGSGRRDVHPCQLHGGHCSGPSAALASIVRPEPC